jgi:hypothetical protein
MARAKGFVKEIIDLLLIRMFVDTVVERFARSDRRMHALVGKAFRG